MRDDPRYRRSLAGIGALNPQFHGTSSASGLACRSPAGPLHHWQERARRAGPDTNRWSRARVQAANRTQRSRCRSWASAAASSLCRGDRRCFRNQALLHADDRDGLELQPFIACMVPAGRPACRPAPQGNRHDAVGFQRLTCLANQPGRAGRHPDGSRLDAGTRPRADPFGQNSEFSGPGGRHQLRTLAAHGRPVAKQRVDLAVQADHRVGAEQRHRPGQDLLGGPVARDSRRLRPRTLICRLASETRLS